MSVNASALDAQFGGSEVVASQSADPMGSGEDPEEDSSVTSFFEEKVEEPSEHFSIHYGVHSVFNLHLHRLKVSVPSVDVDRPPEA